MTSEQLDQRSIDSFARKGALIFLAWAVPISAVAAFLIANITGLSVTKSNQAVLVLIPPLLLVMAFAYPYLLLRWMGAQSLRHRPTDRPGDLVKRLLTLPWRATTLLILSAWLLGAGCFCSALVFFFGARPERALLGMVVVLCFLVVMSFPVSLGLERFMLPLVLQEQQKCPDTPPSGSGPFWPRQAWFLPFNVGLNTLASLVLAGFGVTLELLEARAALRQSLVEGNTQQALSLLDEQGLSSSIGLVLFAVGVLLPAMTTFSTWMVARRQALGAHAIRDTIEGLASGRISPPRWLSTDELGDLAAGLYAVLERLRHLPRTLQQSASRLVAAGDSLGEANFEHQKSLTRQAAALQEAQVTAEEIKQVSMQAAERASRVLQVARRAEELGKRGEASIEESMAGLSSIQEYVESIREQLSRLQESASQIGSVAVTVKELADRSNMLALNAAIEAVRSGEHGKGFAVVAKEIRTLANRSITSTTRISDMLQEVIHAIGNAASMGEEGARQLANDLGRMKNSSDNLRELTQISQETAGAVQQIVYSVNQQNTGFSQIFNAIGDLSQIMADTIQRLESTNEAAGTLKAVSAEVSEVAEQFTVS